LEAEQAWPNVTGVVWFGRWWLQLVVTTVYNMLRSFRAISFRERVTYAKGAQAPIGDSLARSMRISERVRW
jgi:hypothetical protein